MAHSLLQVALFLFLIALAHMLKRIGLFTEREGATLSKITLNITLPAAIVASFNTFKLDYSLLVLIFYGILANVVMMTLSYFSMRKESNGLKGYALLCGSTYNVGNFSFPFVQALFGAPALVAASLFDLGNALMTTGFTYSLASTTAGGSKPNTKDLLKKLFTSVPFITYLVMISLSFANLTLPRFLQDWMQTIGKANPIIAMLMIGFMLDIRFQQGWIKKSVVLLIIRYGLGTVFAYYFLKHTQFNQVIRITLALVVFSPISTSSVAFTEKISNQGKLASFTSSLSVLISVLSYFILAPLLS